MCIFKKKKSKPVVTALDWLAGVYTWLDGMCPRVWSDRDGSYVWVDDTGERSLTTHFVVLGQEFDPKDIPGLMKDIERAVEILRKYEPSVEDKP